MFINIPIKIKKIKHVIDEGKVSVKNNPIKDPTQTQRINNIIINKNIAFILTPLTIKNDWSILW
jgi:hypothetical protein